MQRKHLIITVIALIVILPILWYTLSPLFIDKVVNEEIPVSGTDSGSGDDTVLTSILYLGNFEDADAIHKVSGEARVIRSGDESNGRYLRLEDFESINGPDLYVYLSTGKGNDDFVNLGRLKGNVGNQNYELPEDIDLEKYDNVLIWCQRFSVLFGSAEIEKQ